MFLHDFVLKYHQKKKKERSSSQWQVFFFTLCCMLSIPPLQRPPDVYIQHIQALHHKLCMNPKHWPSQTTTALHQGQALTNVMVQLEENCVYSIKNNLHFTNSSRPPAPSLYGSFIRFWTSSSLSFSSYKQFYAVFSKGRHFFFFFFTFQVH